MQIVWPTATNSVLNKFAYERKWCSRSSKFWYAFFPLVFYLGLVIEIIGRINTFACVQNFFVSNVFTYLKKYFPVVISKYGNLWKNAWNKKLRQPMLLLRNTPWGNQLVSSSLSSWERRLNFTSFRLFFNAHSWKRIMLHLHNGK